MAQRTNRRAETRDRQGQQNDFSFPLGPVLAAHAHATADLDRTLRNFFREKYAPVRLANGTADSTCRHLSAINRLGVFFGREPTLDDLTEDCLEDFTAWALKLPRKPITVNTYLTVLTAQWRFAWKRRMVAELPRDVRKLKVEERVPEAWSQEELASLLTACAATAGMVFGVPARLFWPALVLLIYDTGLRLGPVLKLKTSYLDWTAGWLRVPAADQKDRAEQVFRLHPDTLALLKQFDVQTRELLFFFPRVNLSRTIYRQFSAILLRAGLTATHRDKFHKIRRTSATYLADVAGEVEAQKHLGHSTVELTIRHYIDPTKISRRVIAADVMQRPDWNGRATG